MEIKEALPGVVEGVYGQLVANESSWMIILVFPGPDRRYKSDISVISKGTITHITRLVIEAFDKYSNLKHDSDFALATTTIEIKGCPLPLVANVNGPWDGICLHRRFRIGRTKADVERFIQALETAAARGDTLVAKIKTLQSQ